MLKIVRSEIDFYLNQYEKNEGNSLDYYCENLQLHPMAIAKYLLTLCSLYRSGLMSKANLIKKIKTPIIQLDKLKILFDNEYIFWGLNFNYKNYTANEKYLITTAIIVQSLHELSDFIQEDSLKKLSTQSLRSLEYWLLNKKIDCKFFKYGVPRYSDNIIEPIYNAGAYAFSIIIKYSNNITLKNIANKYMQELSKKAIFGFGWTYSPNSNIIDLLHVCYVSNAYITCSELNSDKEMINILSMLNQFNCDSYFLDSIVLKNNISEWEGGVFRYIDNENFIELKSKSARMWSMGELLIILSNIMQQIKDKNLEILCRKILKTALNTEYKEKEYFRHTMHYTHGLSSFLEVLRNK
jgi:hypothetical protein